MSAELERGPRALLHRTTLQRLNADLALAALERGDGHAAHRPLHVALQVASACNLDCYMCLEHTRPPEERHGVTLRSMSRAVFDRIAEDVFPYSSRLSFAIGGEPTLAAGFERMLERAFESGQEIELLTNGTRLDHGRLAEVVARCVAYLQISLEGATPESYERVRHGARFARLVANLELLNRARLRQRREERTHVSFWVTLLRSTVHELPQVVELAAALDVDRVHAHHVTPATKEAAEESLAEHAELWNDARARAIDYARKLGIEIDVPDPLPVSTASTSAVLVESASAVSAAGENATPAANASAVHEDTAVTPPPPQTAPAPVPNVDSLHAAGDSRALARAEDPRNARVAGRAIPCHMPGTSLYVLWDGRIVPCCYTFALDKMTMGHVGERALDEVWNGRLYKNLRIGMRTGDALSVCLHCPVVHDVPVTPDAEALMRASPTLAEWFDGRDLEPVDTHGAQTDVLARLRTAPALRELDDLRRHAHALEAEREHLRGHARNLESERPHLAGHIANLEAERPHLLAHIANLERELAALRRT